MRGSGFAIEPTPGVIVWEANGAASLFCARLSAVCLIDSLSSSATTASTAGLEDLFEREAAPYSLL